MEELSYLTGKDYSDWDVVMNSEEEKYVPSEVSYQALALTMPPEKKDQGFVLAGLGVLGLVALIGSRQKRNKP